jgi:hypothetical protein
MSIHTELISGGGHSPKFSFREPAAKASMLVLHLYHHIAGISYLSPMNSRAMPHVMMNGQRKHLRMS